MLSFNRFHLLIVSGSLSLLNWLFVTAAVAQQPPRVIAEETRQFDVYVGGKPAGKNEVRIVELSDGTTSAFIEAAIKLDYVIFSYHYDFHGKETWQGDRLIQIDNHADDNGKKFATRATAEAHGLALEVNGKPQGVVPVPALTTSYWRIPAAQGTIAVLDADTGKHLTAKIETARKDNVLAEGRLIPCTHLRLTGSAAAELWFDAQGRLVRQQTTEDGHPTELRLTRIIHTAPAAQR